MKKIPFFALSLTTVCVSLFADAPNEFVQTPVPVNALTFKVINVGQLTDENLNAIMQGQCPELAIEFTEASLLPIQFFLKGDLANLVDTPASFGQIEIKQTFYARCTEEGLILSSNLKEWKPFLEFITGSVTISLEVQEGQPVLKFGSDSSKRA